MGRIIRAEAWLADVEVERSRVDAVQQFVKQETIFVQIETDDGLSGIGYSYTIGTGGRAVLSMLTDHLLPRLMGADPRRPEQVWSDLSNSTRATTVGAVTSLALAAVDTAVWDVCCNRAGEPLWRMAGGYRREVPLYDTEGGWLHLSTDELISGAKAAREAGWAGMKVKVGKPSVVEDLERLRAVREALGADLELMVDANQSFAPADAIRRVHAFEPLDLAWVEEPMAADNVAAHTRLARTTSVPVGVGESLYSVGQFRAYLASEAASVIQVDVARVGGITPWLKVAHLAEAFGAPVAPHFLMELHVSLTAAIPNGLYVEHIPQLRAITKDEVKVVDGRAVAPAEPGLGIAWDHDAIDNRRVA